MWSYFPAKKELETQEENDRETRVEQRKQHNMFMTSVLWILLLRGLGMSS